MTTPSLTPALLVLLACAAVAPGGCRPPEEREGEGEGEGDGDGEGEPGEGEGEGEGDALLEDGSPCRAHAACRSAFCSTGCASGEGCDTAVRNCQPAGLGAFGDACDDVVTGAQCASGVCSPLTIACADCSASTPCADGAKVCAKLQDESERCLAPAAVGEACFFVDDRGASLSHPCAAGLECGLVAAPSATEVSARCVVPVGAGEACDDFSGWQFPPEDGCIDGLVCDASSGTCVLP
ncbi:MAG: hypothetical protein IT383_08705 [Deltaproteobacteria bacterium]|nr:hypothetical protein [Deltaproteobacteria bacterium]